MTDFNAIRAMITGGAIGDALGVPVEFQSREELSQDPVLGMRGYGTHYQPPGTWSDDTSMTLCLLESLSRRKAIDYLDIMENFTRWLHQAEFTANGVVFDVGIATQEAITRYEQGTSPLECGGMGEQDNGNGSLMRIAPLALFLCQQQVKRPDEILQTAHQLSALTHGHPRSQMACGIYTLILMNILTNSSLPAAIDESLKTAQNFYKNNSIYRNEIPAFKRLGDLASFQKLPKTAIRSSGYVVDTLEAVIWCLLHTTSYAECVLTAVNLGDDADTVGAIAGGLAGAVYGFHSIPPSWLAALAGLKEINALCQTFALHKKGTP
jgi:ADP-ribosylglycohydrolase